MFGVEFCVELTEHVHGEIPVAVLCFMYPATTLEGTENRHDRVATDDGLNGEVAEAKKGEGRAKYSKHGVSPINRASSLTNNAASDDEGGAGFWGYWLTRFGVGETKQGSRTRIGGWGLGHAGKGDNE